MSAPRKLIAGLGNPGAEYQGTRHNVGWMVLDHLAAEAELAWKQARDSSHLATWQDALLLKPGTYMNQSGQPVRHYADYYKIPPGHITVVHDDLDIPFGDVRQRRGGGSAGHHGLDSIVRHLGPEVTRIRVGIGRPPLPGGGADYVLSRFSPDEAEKLPAILKRAAAMLGEDDE